MKFPPRKSFPERSCAPAPLLLALGLFLSSRFALGQTYTIQSFAGAGTSIDLVSAGDLAVDSLGGVYVNSNGSVFKIFHGSAIPILGPGSPLPGFRTVGIAVDRTGDLYASENDDPCRVSRVSQGALTVIAGNGTGGDNGPAVTAALDYPKSLATDPSGDLYIADQDNRSVRRVHNGIITTVAGYPTASLPYLGDNGPATAAQLVMPTSVALDAAGSLYIADPGDHRIRKVTNGIITTVAGNGKAGFSGDGGPATNAQLDTPSHVAVDSAGNLYIADTNNNRIRKVSNGVITTIAGDGNPDFGGDGGPALSAQLMHPYSLGVDFAGYVYISDTGNHRVRVLIPDIVTRTLASIADGNQFKTEVLLANAGAAPASYTLRMLDQGGNVPASGFDLESGALSGVIPAGALAVIRTAGLGGKTNQGWGELTASPSVGGSVIYSQQTALPSIQEGTATIGSPPSGDFFVPFDNVFGAVTSIALTNPDQSVAAVVNVTLRYSDGTTEVAPFFNIASGDQKAFSLPTTFPNSSNGDGVAEFVSNVPLSAVAFRFNSTGAFTALDVVPAGESLTLTTRTLAHVAAGNGFKTSILLVNASAVAAPYILTLNDVQGNVSSQGIALEAGTLNGVIPAGGLVTIRTAGSGTQTVQGWAELTAPESVGGSVIYSQTAGLAIQEGTAAIATAGSPDFLVPFDNTNGAVVAIALTNPSIAPTGAITVNLRYSDGTSESVAYPSIAGRTHQSLVIPDSFANSRNRHGVAEFVTSTPLSAVAFLFNSTGAFTAIETVPSGGPMPSGIATNVEPPVTPNSSPQLPW